MRFESTRDVLDKMTLMQLNWKSSTFFTCYTGVGHVLKLKEPLHDMNICVGDIDGGTPHGIHAHFPI